LADLTNPSPVLEIAFGLIGLVFIIVVHGISLRFIHRGYERAWVRVSTATPRWQVNLLLVAVISALALVHMVETLIWALPLSRLGIIPSLRDSYFFVLESYTTLGGGTVAPPDAWRLVGPIVAMSGLFTFGWTGSVLVGIMTEFGRLDRTAARDERGRDDPDRPA